MKQYVCEIEIKKHDFDRINKLMEVMFEDYETDPNMHKLIDELDARKDTTPYSYYFDFEDGSKKDVSVLEKAINKFVEQNYGCVKACRPYTAQDAGKIHAFHTALHYTANQHHTGQSHGNAQQFNAS